jgi:hypothetical protein
MNYPFLIGIYNFVNFLSNQWANIAAILSILWLIYKKIQKLIEDFMKWYKSSDEEKINCAKAQIKQSMLKYITDAEIDYTEMESSGQIKRSQVIRQIYQDFPILLNSSNNESLISWIDEEINDSLKTLREIIKKNSQTTRKEDEL